MFKSISISIILLFLSSCSFFQIHKPIIEQGNIINEAQVSKLSNGMSPSEVIRIMGTPMLENVFTPHQMNYVYTYQVGNQPRIMKKVIVNFVNGQVANVQS